MKTQAKKHSPENDARLVAAQRTLERAKTENTRQAQRIADGDTELAALAEDRQRAEINVRLAPGAASRADRDALAEICARQNSLDRQLKSQREDFGFRTAAIPKLEAAISAERQGAVRRARLKDDHAAEVARFIEHARAFREANATLQACYQRAVDAGCDMGNPIHWFNLGGGPDDPNDRIAAMIREAAHFGYIAA